MYEKNLKQAYASKTQPEQSDKGRNTKLKFNGEMSFGQTEKELLSSESDEDMMAIDFSALRKKMDSKIGTY